MLIISITMKLYYYPGTSSLAIRIMINELEIKCDFEKIHALQTTKKGLDDGRFLSDISPKNQVPVLVLNNGDVLTECISIFKYLSDLNQKITDSTFTQYKLIEWLSYLASEVHKNFIPMIHPLLRENKEVFATFKLIFISKMKYIEKHLADKSFLIEGNFTSADAYLFVIITWFKIVEIDLTQFPNLLNYFNKLKERPSIAKSLKDEGLSV
jgi:glutathione S-transferase